MNIYETLRNDLRRVVETHDLTGRKISVRCKVLSAEEAIGNPDHDDYPISKGKEVMVEAEFNGARGQAFTNAYKNADYTMEEFMGMSLETPEARAGFVSGMNAVYRSLGLCEKTVHCRDAEPLECAAHLSDVIGSDRKVLLVGYQPRFLETLAARQPVRVVDLDPDNIGEMRFGVRVEPPEKTKEAMAWCDVVLATGSTLANGSAGDFLETEKPVIFFGVTISAAARILGLSNYCRCGH